MTIDIFRLNWIAIDTIIIIILIIILILVRLARIIFRWRISVSNTQIKTINFDKKQLNVNVSNIKVKHVKVLLNEGNIIRKEDINQAILMLRNRKSRRLVNVLGQGLANRGYLIFLIHYKSLKSKEEKLSGNNDAMDLGVLIESLKSRNLGSSSANKINTWDVIDFNGTQKGQIESLINEHSEKIILVNPRIKLTKIMDDKVMSTQEDLFQKCFVIFSEKRNKYIKNNAATQLGISNHIPFKIMKGTTFSFKYHETLLLGYILTALEKKERKQQ